MSDDQDRENKGIREEPETWAIIELMGRQVVSGRVSGDTRFGSGLLRIEIPLGGEFVTQYINPAVAIFRMTIVDELAARAKQRRSVTDVGVTIEILEKERALEVARHAIEEREYRSEHDYERDF